MAFQVYTLHLSVISESWHLHDALISSICYTRPTYFSSSEDRVRDGRTERAVWVPDSCHCTLSWVKIHSSKHTPVGKMLLTWKRCGRGHTEWLSASSRRNMCWPHSPAANQQWWSPHQERPPRASAYKSQHGGKWSFLMSWMLQGNFFNTWS